MCLRYLLWKHTTQDAQGLSRDHSCQKQVLCCLVMGAQMSFGYQYFPCLEFRDAAEGDSSSHLTYWSPPATNHGHAQSFSSAGNPWGCVQQHPRRDQEEGLNAPCWPLGQKDLLTEGHSMWDPGSFHVQLYNACGNSIPGLGRALGQIKWTHDVSWRQDMPAASVLFWLGLGPWGRSNSMQHPHVLPHFVLFANSPIPALSPAHVTEG